MDQYECTLCDYIYDPAEGDLDSDIAPDIVSKDLPDDWVCPM